MLEYTSRQITQLVRQYEMFLKSLSIMSSDSDREKIYIQMNRIQEKILEETNSIYEEEYMLLLGSNTYLINEERERLSKLITLIEDRIEYVNNTRQKHKELTGCNVDYPKILGKDKLGEYKNSMRIIDKFNEIILVKSANNEIILVLLNITLDNFSQALTNIGVTSAINLVGGSEAQGWAITADQKQIPIATKQRNYQANRTFITFKNEH